MRTLAVPVVIALLAGFGLHALAQSRIDVRPAPSPMGTSSSNGVSFAWFFDPHHRTVYVCRAGQAPNAAPDCHKETTLP